MCIRDRHEIAMSNIDWLYKSLRQGINHGTFNRNRGGFIPWLYMKPMIFKYAITQNPPIQWEKKSIKQAFFNARLNNQLVDHQPENNPPEDPLHFNSNREHIVRDLLGLSSEQSWMNYPGRNNKPSITKVDINGQIERAASPLRFKPIQHPGQNFYTIYFWSVPINESYLNTSFNIKKDNQNPRNGPLNLQMWNTFNVKDFLNFSFLPGHLEDSVQIIDNRKGEGLSNLLHNIYNDIRNQQLKFND